MTVTFLLNHSWCPVIRLLTVDWKTSGRAVERACYSVVGLVVHLDVVVLGTLDKDWAITLCSSSLLFSSLDARTLSLCICISLREVAGYLAVYWTTWEVISGALRSTYDSSNLLFMQVKAPDNDVVNEVPVFGPGMHPGSHLHVTCDGKRNSEHKESSWR